MINKYYSLTDESIALCVAMGMLVPVSSPSTYILLSVLHPSYKTSYFVKDGWERDWIKAAEDLIQQEWKSHYKLTSPMVNPSTAACSSNNVQF